MNWLVSGVALASGALALLRPTIWSFAAAAILNIGAAVYLLQLMP